MEKLIRLSLIACLLLVNAGTAKAADDTLRFFEEEAQMVQAASWHEQKISDAPADVYIITKEDIERYGYRTLGEALQSAPGIFVRTDRDYSYINVDGFGLPTDVNSHVLLMINGHRINDQDLGQAYYDHLFSVSMKSVERIEVIKGPGAVLYGDNAFLAVINVVTKTAKRAPRLQADAAIGSYGTHEEFLGLTQQFKNGVDVYASGTYDFMKGQDLFYPEFQSVDNNGVSTHSDREMAYNLFSTISGVAAGTRWDLTGNVVNRNKQDPTAMIGSIFNGHRNYVNDSYGFFDLKLKREVWDNVTVEERTSYDWYRNRFDLLWPNFFTLPPPDNVLLKSSDKETWWGQVATARLTPFGESNALTLGGDYQKTIRDHQVEYIEDPHMDLSDVGVSFYRWSLFAQQELQPVRGLELNLGVRYDAYEDFGHTINPRLALIYHPWKDGSVKLVYGTAFVAPTPFQVTDNDFQASFQGLTPFAVKPEMIRSYQAIYQHELPHRGMATVRYFQNRITGLINFVPYITTVQFENTENVRTDGVEIASKYDLGWDVSGHASFMVQRTHDMGGDRLPNSPTNTGALGLSKRLSAWNTILSAEGFFISSNTTFMGTTNPATALLAANIRTQPWINGPTIYAGIRNILNTDYRLTASSSQSQAAIPQDGRNFDLGLEYRFP